MPSPYAASGCAAPCPSLFDADRSWKPSLVALLDRLASDWHRDGVARTGDETALATLAHRLGWVDSGPTLRWRLHERRADEVDDSAVRRAHRVVAAHQLALRRRNQATAHALSRLFVGAVGSGPPSEPDVVELARAWSSVGEAAEGNDVVLRMVERLVRAGWASAGWRLGLRYERTLAPHDHRHRALTWLTLGWADSRDGEGFREAALGEAARSGDDWLRMEVCTTVGLARRDADWTARRLAEILPDEPTT